jgi:hypothetical protein
MTETTAKRTSAAAEDVGPRLHSALVKLEKWIRAHEYAGHEPYDLLNSPFLGWSMRIAPVAIGIIQGGKRFGGSRLRRLLRVPPSRNPKALGLVLSAYCDLARSAGTEAWRDEVGRLLAALRSLRSPGEEEFCWGYDWDFVSARGPRLPRFSPNSIATYFCATALLDAAEVFGIPEASRMAESSGRFIVSRLNRSVNTPEHLCFSYTPENHTRIYNSSALAAELLSRLAGRTGNEEYMGLARRAMSYLASAQSAAGAWKYGAQRRQGWIDSFHTGYNLCALLGYRAVSNDHTYDENIARGYRYYVDTFFHGPGIPGYFHDSLYPIDIHSSSQAILAFCAFHAAQRDEEGLERAVRVADWTLANMRSPEGVFYYQKHRCWTNRMPYFRWGQAWMLRALAHLWKNLQQSS